MKRALALAIAGFGCSDPEVSNSPTWYGEVLPVVQEHCLPCHTAGGIGAFSMDVDPADPAAYEDFKRTAKSIAIAARADNMPPWPPDPACRSYHDERRLTDDEKQLLMAWADSGAGRGDPNAAPAPRAAAELDRVDLALDTGASYLPQTSDYGDTQCFVLDPAFADAVDVTGLRVVPGSQRVHGVLVFSVDRAQALAADDADAAVGFDCFGAPLGGGLIGSWVPSAPPFLYPEGTGVRISPENALVLQVSYDLATGEAVDDLTGLELRFADTPLARPASIQIVRNDSFSIPAMTRDVTANTALALGEPGVIWGVATELKLRGTAAALRLRTPAGTQCLLDIPQYSSDWQELYLLTDEAGLGFGAGDSVELDCTWDNSSMQAIGPGPNSMDELCVAYLLTSGP